MRELITPEDSERFVLLASLLLALIGGAWGFRTMRVRGLSAALLGPLLWALWQGHKWVTRYDPQTGYFGLQSVVVVLLEAGAFVLLGAGFGVLWRKLAADGAQINADE